MNMDSDFDNIRDESVRNVLREMWRRIKVAQATTDQIAGGIANEVESLRQIVALERHSRNR